jgi:hypothetical protein
VNSTNAPSKTLSKTALLIALAAVLAAIVTIGILYRSGMLGGRSRQAEVAARGAQVMPFDLEQTTHVFQQLPDGGLQTVTAKDPANTEQIALIQAHLQEEAVRFRRGDFGDPATIHGQDMPGLADLKAGATKIDVQYTALANGGQLRYATSDPALIMALHHWFAAQISDHGAHATGQ